MPTLPHIAPCTHNTPCLEYPCRLANPPAAFAAPVMAGEEQQQNAEANVAMSPLPDFFTNTPTIWFQQAEARFAAARPALTSGQKYFQLLGKLPQDLMVNFTDIIAQCTIAAARNNGDPYTDMKDAILQFTTKPKWSCYFDLHTLPPQGDIRPSQLMAKLIGLMPPGAPTNTDLFYSFFLFRMPQSIREALAATDYPDARSMAAAADRIWDLRQTAPPAVAAAAPTRDRSQSPHSGGRNSRRDNHRRSPSRRRRGRAQTPHHNAQDNDNGICWYHNKFQHKSYRCISPCRWQGNRVTSR
jgi:hypothetical protein